MKFKSKVVEIEAIQFNGAEDIPKVHRFCPIAVSQINNDTFETRFVIPTLEGDMICRRGDWIIKGTIGEFYPCKDEVFRQKYEAIK